MIHLLVLASVCYISCCIYIGVKVTLQEEKDKFMERFFKKGDKE
jgi:hypothetical protein